MPFPSFDRELVDEFLHRHPHAPLFVTMSGAHLYGFPSPDSDYDLRGAHVTDPRAMLGLSPPRETYDVLDRDARIEIDLVTHDIRKFFLMLLKKNGYVLEQICSPLVVEEREGFRELVELAKQCITRFHHFHFERFAKNQWERVMGPDTGTVKGLLYTYRPLMAGIHLMREQEVESSIVELNKIFGFSFVDELVTRKISGDERQAIGDADMGFHEAEFTRLVGELHAASERSGLPESPPDGVRGQLDDLLIRLRLGPASP